MKTRVAFAIPLILFSCSSNGERYLNRCQSELNNGNFAEAVLECRKAIQKEPSLGEAHYWLGLAYVKQNRGAEAYDALRASVQLRTEDAAAREAFADVALAALQESKNSIPSLYKDVLENADWLLQRDKDSVPGLRLKGTLALLDKKPSEAVSFFQKASTLKPADPNLTVRLSNALFAQGQFGQGESIALALIEKKQSFGAAYDLLYDQYSAAERFNDAERVLVKRVAAIWNPPSIVQLALHYSRANKPVERDATIEQLTARSRYPGGPILAGDFYLSIGDAETAIRHYEAGITKYPDNRAAYQRKLINALLTQRRDDEALRRAEELVKENPKDFEGRAIRATLLFESGKFDHAVPMFKELVQERPNDATLRYNFGRVYVAKQDWNAAIPEFQAATKQPRFIPPRILLAEIQLLLGKPTETIRWSQQVIAIDPDNAKARLLHAIGLKETGQLEEARAELLKLQARLPDRTEVKLQLGLVELARNRLTDAETIFRSLLGNQEDVRATAGLSETLALRNQTDNALALLEQSLKKKPNLQLARIYASLAVRTRKYDLAIGQLEQLRLASPHLVEPLLLLGDVHRVKGDYKSALLTLEQARQMRPDNIGVLSQIAYLQQVSGNRDEALSLYRRIRTMQPENAALLNNMASVLAEGDPKSVEEASILIGRALQISPNNPNYTDTLGTIYLRRNMTDSALQIFSNLVSQSPENATFQHHLGLAFLQRGRGKDASIALDKALKHVSPGPEEAKIRQTLDNLSKPLQK